MINLGQDLEDSEAKEKDMLKLKASLEKQHGREFSQEEVTQARRSLLTFAKVSYDIYTEDVRRKELLRMNPKGYHLKKGGTCIICRTFFKEEKTWYDKHGLKCIFCQQALNDKILPISIIKDQNQDSWYTTLDLESYFNLKGNDLKKCIKASFLKVRSVAGEGNKTHLQVFLIKDNKDVLPPKRLLKSKMVIVTRDGKDYYAADPWYDHFSAAQVKRLTKYRIFECLAYTFSKPIDMGRLLVPVGGLNPLFSFKESF